MTNQVIELTKRLISIPSFSQKSNKNISDFLERRFKEMGFTIKRTGYQDKNGEEKITLLAKRGSGTGGLAFCAHSDTVPGNEHLWDAFEPMEADGQLLGRGSCDMKGPIAAALEAIRQVEAAQLNLPIYVIVTADEELGLVGAEHLAGQDEMWEDFTPEYGIITEPTSLDPVYAHKGMLRLEITATGKAAHTSTDLGISANFLIAPFLAEMADLAQKVKQDERYMNHEFDPPTNGFNMTLNDYGCAMNVSAAKSTCGLSIRAMPNSNLEELVTLIRAKAEVYGFKITHRHQPPLYLSPNSSLVKIASDVTGRQSRTVSFGTDGIYLQQRIPQLVVLGPGDIRKAHTVGESIPLNELTEAVDIYRRLIERLCR